jgi:hypothetical protein
VRGDGTFRYIGMTETGAPLTREGTLSRAFLTELGGELTSTQLYTQSRVIEPASCDSYVDGIDYKYEITLNTVIFTLDTCGTDFTLESSTGQTLDKLWKYFASLS